MVRGGIAEPALYVDMSLSCLLVKTKNGHESSTISCSTLNAIKCI